MRYKLPDEPLGTIRVIDNHGMQHRVFSADYLDQRKIMLPWYNAKGEKWASTKEGVREVATGSPFGIHRSNIVSVWNPNP